MANQMKKINSKTIVLVGDGELNEGSNWESALFAVQHKLSNLFCIIDNNLSTIKSTKVENIDSIFKSFGWNVVNVDGHNIIQIVNSFSLYDNDKPTAIVASTIKGKGAVSMENNPEWHHKSPSKEEMIQLINQIKEYRK
jgi:transketolase